MYPVLSLLKSDTCCIYYLLSACVLLLLCCCWCAAAIRLHTGLCCSFVQHCAMQSLLQNLAVWQRQQLWALRFASCSSLCMPMLVQAGLQQHMLVGSCAASDTPSCCICWHIWRLKVIVNCCNLYSASCLSSSSSYGVIPTCCLVGV
jgi:hypothetical protein